MSSPLYSLNRLAAIYATAYDYEEPTLAFEAAIGQGRLLFMMFFSDEDNRRRAQHLSQTRDWSIA
ncbi:hypothetical protein KAK07_23355 [Ideonella sp. 4Y16]|uniref:Uncharacterized protein n=1 Tax=Ideonella aquatica TaxID=2824119 RepID=A0A941BII5_9BURK|nr:MULTISPECIES: hypothetical protein [Ideonella]MBQ0946296.1 hypothetical protein [Ideonella alba]MBQ0962006.1 hypothetical protein [Ideonella aquatica]